MYFIYYLSVINFYNFFNRFFKNFGNFFCGIIINSSREVKILLILLADFLHMTALDYAVFSRHGKGRAFLRTCIVH